LPLESNPKTYSDEKVANRDIRIWYGERKWFLNDGQIQNPSNPFGIVPLSNFVPRVLGFVHHSIAILYHQVPNPNITIRNFFIAVKTDARLDLEVSAGRAGLCSHCLWGGHTLLLSIGAGNQAERVESREQALAHPGGGG
jgi:hypothetical protein